MKLKDTGLTFQDIKDKVNKYMIETYERMDFLAESANYGEGIGNISSLKKMTRGNHEQYSYISRQAMRYNIVQQLKWDNTPVDGKSGVVQFAPSATIKDYPEIDLFGYMKTVAKKETQRHAKPPTNNFPHLLFLTSASSSTPQATPARNISIAIGIDVLHLLPLLHFNGNSNAADHQCQYQSCDKFLHVKFLQFFILCFTL